MDLSALKGKKFSPTELERCESEAALATLDARPHTRFGT